jgi:hypothetical protein
VDTYDTVENHFLKDEWEDILTKQYCQGTKVSFVEKFFEVHILEHQVRLKPLATRLQDERLHNGQYQIGL